MSESSGTGPVPASKAASPPRSAAPRAAAARQLPSWLTVAALIVGLIAVALAVIGWFRPSTGPGKFSSAQADDAKAHICQVTSTVREGVGLNTNLANPVPGDPIGGLAVAANARLALFGGGSYLQQRLAAEPATPADLAKAASAMADTIQELSINYLAGAAADDPVQQPLRDNLTSQLAELDQLCQ